MGSTAVIVIILAGVVFATIAVYMVAQRRAAPAPSPEEQAAAERLPAPLAEFHIRGDEAQVTFAVPLAEGGADPVLTEMLLREAVEVVREKRHSLPIGDVKRVVAFGQHNGEAVRVGAIDLDTPGELPPPVAPELIPRLGRGFDPFEILSDLKHAPGLAGAAVGEELAPLGQELRLAANVEAGLRAQGVDPATAGAGDVVIGIMRLTGHMVDDRGDNIYRVTRAGETTHVRVVPHAAGDHPELSEDDIRRFAVNFAESGADRGLLVTEKYSPFEIYERERREPRVRFVTRERLQHFVDALALR